MNFKAIVSPNVLFFGMVFSLLNASSAFASEIPSKNSNTASKRDDVLFVSNTGNDGNNGAAVKPFRTLSKALVAAKNLKNKNVIIQLRGGTYYLAQTIRLKPDDISAKSLTIENYPGEEVFISAGRRLNLKWQPYRNGILRSQVPSGISFERLYINGMLQNLARYPNYDPKARVYNGTAADAISPERVKRWKNPTGGYVHALHDHEWGSFDYLITGKDASNKLTLTGGWQNNRPSEMHQEYRFVENIMEELDCSSEWYFDKASHTLYYYPQKGVTISSAIVEVSNLKNSIELIGTAAKPVRNVQIKGITFQHNERAFMDNKEPLLRSDWTIYRGGAVLFDGTEHCRITDCNFTGLGGNAMMLSNYNLKDSITGCLVEHVGASAVCFVGSTKAVRSPLFKYDDALPYDQIDQTPGPLNNDFPQHCVVDNNLFHDLGEVEKQATGVEITISAGITVTHNSIYHTPRAGINIGDGCFGGHIIAYNDVFNNVLETGDHGSFNSWGRDRYWNPDRTYMDSIVNVHPELILLDAQKQTAIHDNRFRCDHGWDIDLDDGSTNYHIYNNVLLNGGLKLREGFYRIVENNIMVNNSFHPHVWFINSGDVFEHNIITTKYAPVRITDWGKRIDHNFFIDASGLAAARQAGTDVNSINGDPLFLDSKKGDYMLASNSPALTVGFKNIRMDWFGVQKPSLKKLALKPVINPLVETDKLSDHTSVAHVLGADLKTVDGLSDRSAYGLPDEKGVVIVNAGSNSLFSRSGFMNKDVIRAVQGKTIANIQDLMEVLRSEQGTSTLSMKIIRDQKALQRDLKIK